MARMNASTTQGYGRPFGSYANALGNGGGYVVPRPSGRENELEY